MESPRRGRTRKTRQAGGYYSSGRLEGDAAETARVLGMANLQYVVVPWIYRNLDAERVLAQTDGAIDGLVRELTTARQTRNGHVALTKPERFNGCDRFEAVERMNEAFLLRDWGDGYTLLPPTPEAVDRLFKGTCLPRDHVLCDLPPGWGLATIEKVAITQPWQGRSRSRCR